MSGLHLLQTFFKAFIQIFQKWIAGYLCLALLRILLSNHLQAAQSDASLYFQRISKDSLWHYGMNKPKLNLSFELDHSTIPLIHSSEFEKGKPFLMPKAGQFRICLGPKHFKPRLRFGQAGALEYFWVKAQFGKALQAEDLGDFRGHHPELVAGSKIPLNPCASFKKLILGSGYGGVSCTGIFLSQKAYLPHLAFDVGGLYGCYAQMVGKFKKKKEATALEFIESRFISDFQLHAKAIASFFEAKICQRWPFQEKGKLLSQRCFSHEFMAWLPFFPALALGYSAWHQNANEKNQLNFTELQAFNDKFLGIYDAFCQSWWQAFLCIRLGPYIEGKLMYGRSNWVKGGSQDDEVLVGGQALPASWNWSVAWNFRMSEVSARAFEFQRADAYQNFYARLLQPISPMLLSSTNIITAS